MTRDDAGGWRGLALTALVLLATISVLLGASLYGGKVLTQADALFAFEPWRSHAPADFQPSNGLLLDQSIVFAPWKDFEAAQVAKGELPLWNPHNYAGQPLVGSYQSAIYSPFSWIYYAWPSWHTHAWVAALELLLAGLFGYLFLVRIGITPAAARVGGTGYMLSGFFIAWLGHPHTNAALFLPALLGAVERIHARPGGREAALLALLVALQFFAGHVQTSLFLGIATLAWTGYRLLVPVAGRRGTWRGTLWIGLGGVLGTVLAAPQLWPFVEYLGHSQAAGVFERMDSVPAGAAHPGAWLLVDPWHFGAPHEGTYTGPLGPNLNFNELIGGYVGRVLLAFALLAAGFAGWRRGLRWTTLFFVLTGVLAGLVAYQVEPFYSLARAVPALRSTKLLRLSLLLAFALCVLGALGVQHLLRRVPWPRSTAAGVLLLVAAEGLWFGYGYNPQIPPQQLPPRTELERYLSAEQGLFRSLPVDNSVLKPSANLFARVNLLSGYDSVEDRRYAELLLRCTSRPPQYPFVSTIAYFDRPECLPLLSLLGAKFVLSDVPLPPPLRRVHEAEIDVWENPLVQPRAFLTRRCALVPDAEERLQRMTRADFDPGVALLERDSEELRRVRAAQDLPLGEDEGATITHYAPREVTIDVQCAAPSLLVLTDVWNEGWHAELEDSATGTRQTLAIERVDHALRGLWLEPGRWRVHFAYVPVSTRLGLLAALLAAATLVLLALRGQRSSKMIAVPSQP